ncbi:hypothetical protein [Parasedimentitalea psychrophila]|uniref:Bacteriophage tail fiber protein n=1 Tax=Parasedimentitalea psychrophila TaxID=2997337 RepID=A0A9Y2NZN8_9RHOB|nr:hypothetical protein [Parasedimentitalea psychrophila]WIY23791.1 hypothetical protein QPJ95_14185 [Parasedimentitalea psychrophila]
MTNLPEAAAWIAGIYQIEQSDPVLGGPPNIETGAGIANVQAQQLAERTAWLKTQIAAAVATVISTGTGLSGGGAIDTGLTLVADLADQAVAEAGSNNLQLMTALRTRQAIEVAINALVGAAPAQLDTLNELAAAITDNGDTSAALTALIAAKLDAANYTAADVLAKLLSVDGAGSGLDADMLDGKNSASFVQTTRNVSTGTGLSGGGTLGADLTISASIATQAQAEAGTNSNGLMTPERVAQAIAALQRPDYDSGWVSGWTAPFSVLHGLASTPMRYQWMVKCHTATNGFVVGDVIMVLPYSDGDGSRRRATHADSSAINIHQEPNGGSTSGGAIITYGATKFDIRAIAWKE